VGFHAGLNPSVVVQRDNRGATFVENTEKFVQPRRSINIEGPLLSIVKDTGNGLVEFGEAQRVSSVLGLGEVGLGLREQRKSRLEGVVL
jgi:hypothetical protein